MHRLNRSLAFLLPLVLMLVVTGRAVPATAGVIFDNGGSNLLQAGFSDSDTTAQSFQTADSFVLTSGLTTIRDIHWWGVYGFSNTPPATDNFTIQILADEAGVPGSVLHTLNVGNVDRTATGDTASGLNLFAFSKVIPPITLDANTAYWLSILNNTMNDIDDNWAWAVSAQPGTAVQKGLNPFEPGWSPTTGGYAFNLTDDVVSPTPQQAFFTAFNTAQNSLTQFSPGTNLEPLKLIDDRRLVQGVLSLEQILFQQIEAEFQHQFVLIEANFLLGRSCRGCHDGTSLRCILRIDLSH